MSKKIQDYLPYYIGQEIISKATGETIGIVEGIQGKKVLFRSRGVWYDTETHNLKLRLRPLSDMTDKELSECGNMLYDFSDDPDPEMRTHKWEYFRDMIASEQFHYLLKQGFDLFGLIEAGLAVDKTKEVK